MAYAFSAGSKKNNIFQQFHDTYKPGAAVGDVVSNIVGVAELMTGVGQPVVSTADTSESSAGVGDGEDIPRGPVFPVGEGVTSAASNRGIACGATLGVG